MPTTNCLINVNELNEFFLYMNFCRTMIHGTWIYADRVGAMKVKFVAHRQNVRQQNVVQMRRSSNRPVNVVHDVKKVCVLSNN